MTLARRHIDPTNAERRARIVRQHGMEIPEARQRDGISKLTEWAGIVVGALVFAICLYAWIVGDQPTNLGVM